MGFMINHIFGCYETVSSCEYDDGLKNYIWTEGVQNCIQNTIGSSNPKRDTTN